MNFSRPYHTWVIVSILLVTCHAPPLYSKEITALEVVINFDGLCLKNSANYNLFDDKKIMALGAIKIDPEKNLVDPNFIGNIDEVRSYFIPAHETNLLLTYTSKTCTIVYKNIASAEIKVVIKNLFPISNIETVRDGGQSIDYITVKEMPSSEPGIIYYTYSIDEKNSGGILTFITLRDIKKMMDTENHD